MEASQRFKFRRVANNDETKPLLQQNKATTTTTSRNDGSVIGALILYGLLFAGAIVWLSILTHNMNSGFSVDYLTVNKKLDTSQAKIVSAPRYIVVGEPTPGVKSFPVSIDTFPSVPFKKREKQRTTEEMFTTHDYMMKRIEAYNTYCETSASNRAFCEEMYNKTHDVGRQWEPFSVEEQRKRFPPVPSYPSAFFNGLGEEWAIPEDAVHVDTLKEAIDLLESKVVTNTTVLVHPGTYAEPVRIGGWAQDGNTVYQSEGAPLRGQRIQIIGDNRFIASKTYVHGLSSTSEPLFNPKAGFPAPAQPIYLGSSASEVKLTCVAGNRMRVEMINSESSVFDGLAVSPDFVLAGVRAGDRVRLYNYDTNTISSDKVITHVGGACVSPFYQFPLLCEIEWAGTTGCDVGFETVGSSVTFLPNRIFAPPANPQERPGLSQTNEHISASQVSLIGLELVAAPDVAFPVMIAGGQSEANFFTGSMTFTGHLNPNTIGGLNLITGVPASPTNFYDIGLMIGGLPCCGAASLPNSIFVRGFPGTVRSGLQFTSSSVELESFNGMFTIIMDGAGILEGCDKDGVDSIGQASLNMVQIVNKGGRAGIFQHNTEAHTSIYETQIVGPSLGVTMFATGANMYDFGRTRMHKIGLSLPPGVPSGACYAISDHATLQISATARLPGMAHYECYALITAVGSSSIQTGNEATVLPPFLDIVTGGVINTQGDFDAGAIAGVTEVYAIDDSSQLVVDNVERESQRRLPNFFVVPFPDTLPFRYAFDLVIRPDYKNQLIVNPVPVFPPPIAPISAPYAFTLDNSELTVDYVGKEIDIRASLLGAHTITLSGGLTFDGTNNVATFAGTQKGEGLTIKVIELGSPGTLIVKDVIGVTFS